MDLGRRKRARLRGAGKPASRTDWWPEFEQQFRAYVRQHNREAL